MRLVFFLSPTDPRMLAAVEAMQRELVSDSLVHRYNPALTAEAGPAPRAGRGTDRTPAPR